MACSAAVVVVAVARLASLTMPLPVPFCVVVVQGRVDTLQQVRHMLGVRPRSCNRHTEAGTSLCGRRAYSLLAPCCATCAPSVARDAVVQLPPRTAELRVELLNEAKALRMPTTRHNTWHTLRGIWPDIVPAFEADTVAGLLGSWTVYDHLAVDPLHDVGAAGIPAGGLAALVVAMF